MTNFGGVDVLPLLGAIVGCHCGVLCLGGERGDQLWGSGRAAIAGSHRRVWCYGWEVGWWPTLGSGRAAIAGCHCGVPWFGGGVMTNFGGVDVLPLLGAIVGCHCGVLCLGGRVMTNFGGVDVLPLLGAIVVCRGSGVGWWPILGEWTCCHCWVPS